MNSVQFQRQRDILGSAQSPPPIASTLFSLVLWMRTLECPHMWSQ